MTKLPRRQKQLYDLLFGRGDVAIDDLFRSMRGAPSMAGSSVDQQRWLSPYITALNRNLEDDALKVEPGALKNTYRLVRRTA